MGFRDLKNEFDKLTPADLHDPDLNLEDFQDLQDKSRAARMISAEQTFRYWQLKLLLGINDQLTSLAMAYQELVKMQKDKRGE